ncbi:MAG TPA: protein kinase [Thermoanaerobaculia bacterium]|nr:protein kinase [Thermoanaerobaculia bacterium]
MTLTAGTRLGPYEILSKLGAGGMGEVYRARDSRLERDVAVKVLPKELVSDPEALSRFEKEAKAVAALSHPNILAIHDFGNENGVAYAIMELLEGDTLREKLDAGALPQRKALDYALQIAQGLAAAHERGIVHRDLKPQNLFVTRDGIVKILDFGLVKRRLETPGDENSSAPTTPGTRTGTILGTVGYMSPEQVRGMPADHRSDIFALGAVLFEMLTGGRAFRQESDVETMMSILREDPLDASPAGRALPPEIAEIVGHCLEKSPEERFQSARDLAFALRVAEREARGPSSGRSDGAPRSGVTGVLSSEAAGPSIAVLPFRNLSPEKESEYFSDGVTEEIINALSKIEALRVASRTSAFAFKGKDEDVRRIGAALGVGSVLEGSVRQSGKRIRIGAQLVNVADGYRVWSERYDRQMEDVFDVQDEIARSIAEALKVRLLPSEVAGLSSRGTDNVEAYNDYLKGLYYFNRREAPEAIAEFERALARDPRYTAAYTGLADSYCIYGFYGGIPTLDAFAKARDAARKAEELEPDSAEVLVALALVEHYFGWDMVKEEAELRKAIRLSPSSAAAHSWLGLMLAFNNRAEEALELARRATQLEPFSPNAQTNVGWGHFGARRFEESLAEFRRALHIDPNAPYPLWAIAINYMQLQRPREAIAALEKAIEVTKGRQSHYVALLGGAYAAAGKTKEALDLLDELNRRLATEYIAPFHLAFLHIPLGNADVAIDCLERSCAERNALGWWPRACAFYDPLRSHPRFPALLSRIVPA